MKESIGIFLGSFNPPHLGHYSVVDGALKSNLVDKVVVVPAYHNLWKDKQIDFWIRYKWCKTIFQPLIDEGKVEISAIESCLHYDYPKGVPTYITLLNLSEIYKGQIVIITTKSTYSEILQWEFGKEILERYKFLLAGEDFNIINIPICSTSIRESIMNKNFSCLYLNKEVQQFIISKNLYQ